MPRRRLGSVSPNTFLIDILKRIFRSKTNRRAAICPALLFLRAPLMSPARSKNQYRGFCLNLATGPHFHRTKPNVRDAPTGVLPRDGWRIGFQTHEKP